jgi:hypothetical protein
MKLIIFLLLLSCNCFGQIQVFYEPPDDDGVTKGEGQVIILYDTAVAPPSIPDRRRSFNGLRWDRKACPHKWIELHQDTVAEKMPTNPYNEIHKAVPAIHIVPFWIEPEFTESIPLICLWCHQEKKKVIHYKKR